MRLAMKLKDLKNAVMAEGIAKGEAKEKTTIAKSMLATGSVTVDFIAQVTKLSLADVQKLQAEMQATN